MKNSELAKDLNLIRHNLNTTVKQNNHSVIGRDPDLKTAIENIALGNEAAVKGQDKTFYTAGDLASYLMALKDGQAMPEGAENPFSALKYPEALANFLDKTQLRNRDTIEIYLGDKVGELMQRRLGEGEIKLFNALPGHSKQEAAAAQQNRAAGGVEEAGQHQNREGAKAAAQQQPPAGELGEIKSFEAVVEHSDLQAKAAAGQQPPAGELGEIKSFEAVVEHSDLQAKAAINAIVEAYNAAAFAKGEGDPQKDLTNDQKAEKFAEGLKTKLVNSEGFDTNVKPKATEMYKMLEKKFGKDKEIAVEQLEFLKSDVTAWEAFKAFLYAIVTLGQGQSTRYEKNTTKGFADLVKEQQAEAKEKGPLIK